ncbi:phenazine biosynthesis PhzF [Legionella rubrilucens]|uniref:Phenazine biosynthesis PhzF n=1 Tax=Legionella rubrilucens TaxID=458 RepID=A0A0W0Y632_9GAMM|nr:PhzF family phenazine biosynthesis protein [Legionella rubrilucens]KTD52429.1 phenazine biosynthesis PhzF [Legionella rubrilucens]
MQSMEIFQIDAFTDKVFHGNPAAVCLLSEWLNDELMQAIAVENNLSETAFVIRDHEGFRIRWFTPRGEISLCGHATLAAGFALFELGYGDGEYIEFKSLSGLLRVRKRGNRYVLDFPRLHYKAFDKPALLIALVDEPLLEIYESDLDYLAVLDNEAQVLKASVNLTELAKLPKRGLILTAPGVEVDFYSRCFYPKHNIPEDPVTGSAHCVLTPFWTERLQKQSLKAIQGSFRKGELSCEMQNERVYISGNCRWYSKGQLVI